MNDPFFIEGPALLSLSGGRTSAYMLWRILQAHGGVLPPYIHVVFANTGKEREETLRFVHEISVRWGVHVVWVEFVTDLRSAGAAGRVTVVGYNSASRAGEPLDRLIARKKAIFSTVRGRWCTERCKVGALIDYMETIGHLPGSYTELIGFRADEGDRVYELPRKPRNAGRSLSFPLAEASIRKGDVNAFWSGHDFDLMIPRGTGNCDHCPFMAFKARVARARRNPEGIEWWLAKEEIFDFAFAKETFAEVVRAAENQFMLDLDDIEQDAADSECAGWCGE